MFDQNDVRQIEGRGSSVSEVEAQVERFRKGFPWLDIVAPATPGNGIKVLGDDAADRAVQAHDGSIVVAFWNGEFTMKYLDLTHKSEGYIELRPANDKYPVFRVEAGDTFEVWGVVVHLIRTFETL